MTGTPAIERFWEVFRFGFVGGLASLVHFAVASLLFWMMPGWLFAANVVGFVVAFFVSYFGHYHLTFRAGTAHGDSIWRFGLVALLGFGINMVVLALFTWLVGYQTLAGLAVAIVFAAGSVYLLSRRWAFAG